MGDVRELKATKIAVFWPGGCFSCSPTLCQRSSTTIHLTPPGVSQPIPVYSALNMANPNVQHAALNATFKGILRENQGTPIHQFLGIKYASVSARFEKAEPVDGFEGGIVDATKYGWVLLF